VGFLASHCTQTFIPSRCTFSLFAHGAELFGRSPKQLILLASPKVVPHSGLQPEATVLLLRPTIFFEHSFRWDQ
jgi:hypothetical protein